jgi:hypothetical protein
MSEANKLEEAIEFYWGERCPDKHANCVICQAWAQYDVLNLALRVLTEQMAEGVEQWKPKKEQA